LPARLRSPVACSSSGSCVVSSDKRERCVLYPAVFR
jgi:hypothetical protein